MIEKAIAILQQAGFDFTPKELAEVLWLAIHIEPSTSQSKTQGNPQPPQLPSPTQPSHQTTVVKMMESLPEDVQEKIVEHLREYILDLQDELQWDKSFKKTQSKLVAAAKRARQEISEGIAKPMDYEKL